MFYILKIYVVVESCNISFKLTNLKKIYVFEQLMNTTIMTPILSNLIKEDIELSWDLLSLFTVSKRYKYRLVS